jgi:hypothetical protein
VSNVLGFSLLTSVISSGGRDAFKWSDVQESSHRENYLGHSIMAPVGRWQKDRDLQWYAKANQDGSKSPIDQETTERREEIHRIKEAEREAMAQALGLPAAPRSTNPNLTVLGNKEVQKAIQETTADDEEGGGGVGFGSYGGGFTRLNTEGNDERLESVGVDVREPPNSRTRADRSRSPGRQNKCDQSRNRDRNWDRERQKRHPRQDYERERYRHERRHGSKPRSWDQQVGRHEGHHDKRSPSYQGRDKWYGGEYHRSHRNSTPNDRREYSHSRRERNLEYSHRR